MAVFRCCVCGEQRELADDVMYAYCHRCGAKLGPENMLAQPPVQGAYQAPVQNVQPPVQSAYQAPVQNVQPPVQSAYQAPVQNAQPPVQSAYQAPVQNVQPPMQGAYQTPVQNAQPPMQGAYQAPVQNAQPPMQGAYQAPYAGYPYIPPQYTSAGTRGTVYAPFPVAPQPSPELVLAHRRERSDVFRRSCLVGAGLLAFEVIWMVLWNIYSLISKTYGGTAFFSADGGEIASNLIYTIISPLSFVSVALIFCAIIRLKPYEAVDFSLPKSPAVFFGAFFLCLGVVYPAGVVTNIVYSIFDIFGGQPSAGDSALPTTVTGILLYFLSTAVIPAISEELMFRGFVLGGLRKYGTKNAVILSAVLFSLMHMNFVQIPYTLIFGFFLGYVTVRTESIWPAVAAHFANNFMSCALEYITYSMSDNQALIVSYCYYAITVALGIAGIFMLRSKRTTLRRVTNENGGVLTAKERLGRTLSAPTIIIFGLYCLYQAFANL